MYSPKVMDHFTNPRNVGSIDNADGIGEEGNPVCGDMMTFYIKVKDDRLVDIKYKTFGCGAAIAVSSMISEMAMGKTLGEALNMSNKDVADQLDGLPARKLHCSNLGADALHKAIEDYFTKHPEARARATVKPKSRDEVYEERFGGLAAKPEGSACSACEPPPDHVCCPFCSAVIAKNSAVCEPCGMELVTCPKCGTLMGKNAHDCPVCGFDMEHHQEGPTT